MVHGDSGSHPTPAVCTEHQLRCPDTRAQETPKYGGRRRLRCGGGGGGGGGGDTDTGKHIIGQRGISGPIRVDTIRTSLSVSAALTVPQYVTDTLATDTQPCVIVSSPLAPGLGWHLCTPLAEIKSHTSLLRTATPTTGAVLRVVTQRKRWPLRHPRTRTRNLHSYTAEQFSDLLSRFG